MAPAADSPPCLEVRDLKTYFFSGEGTVRAVDGVSFSLARGETLGLAGESGCGKSVTALSILRLVEPPGRITGGSVRLDGRELLALSPAAMRRIRGRRISMVFQEPMTSLNPVFATGHQVAEAIQAHKRVSSRQAREEAIEWLRRVKIPAPEKCASAYPHQLSGGMRQRVMIAMALACRPQVLLADEPTTALDVTIQAQIMELLGDLQRELEMSVLLITHNLALLAQAADRIAVMYASRIVEESPVEELFAAPLHPYTQGLLASLPALGRSRREKLHVIRGSVPNPLTPPPGCRFHPRCPIAEERCHHEEPALREVGPGRRVACWLAPGGPPAGPAGGEG